MSIEAREKIKRQVFAKLKEILCENDIIINESDEFITDLKIISDDLSFTFIPDIEDLIGVYGTQKQWLSVHSVRDSIELLLKLKKV